MKPAWGHFKATLGPSWDHKGPSDIKMSPRRAEGGQKSPRWPKIVSTWSQDGGGGLGACTAQRGEWGGQRACLLSQKTREGVTTRDVETFRHPKPSLTGLWVTKSFDISCWRRRYSQPARLDRQTGRQTSRQTAIHIYIHTYTHIYIHTYIHIYIHR